VATTEFDRLEYYRERYAELKPGWEPATARYQRWVAQRLTPTANVLDLGCGRGGIVERLHPTGHWIGVDPDFVSLQGHRMSALPRGQAAAEQLPFPNATFDIVVSSWVLEHLPAPAATFAEVCRVLRPEGYFIFITPNARHPIPQFSRALRAIQQKLVLRLYGRAAHDTFPIEYQANTLEQISTMATRAGLRMVKVELVDDPAYFAWNALTFKLATWFEVLLPAQWKVHLIGEYIRPN
jgi:ubiquinone/menaquinone biosynthesis C-methylase UbiE